MKIKPIEYEGSISHFRAWMDRYIAVNGNGHTVMNMAGQRDYVVFYESHGQTSTREIWNMQSRLIVENGEQVLEIRRGMILATETSPNRTNVDFLDGQYFGFRNIPWRITGIERQNLTKNEKPLMMVGIPIGEDFIRYAEEIKMEFEREQRIITDGDSLSSKFEKPTPDKVEPVEYPGSVAHFRGWMNQYLAKGNDRFTFINPLREYKIDYQKNAQTSTREAWKIYHHVQIPDAYNKLELIEDGLILAVEISQNRTVIEFLDGVRIHPPENYAHGDPLGRDFVEIATQIKIELSKMFGQRDKSETLPPWERIPNIGWNRKAIQLWHEGYTTAEIAKRVGKDEQTIRNKIANLRKEHGEEIVPSRRR